LRLGLALRFAALVALVLLAAGAASAQPLSVNGVAGFLSEWQFSGSVTETASEEFTGSLAMKHVGLCSHDGPDERTSEIRLRLTGFMSARSKPAKAASELKATFVLDGATCTLAGRFSGTYTGVMDCAGTKRVPVTLSVN
jgi:hypothetical protein